MNLLGMLGVGPRRDLTAGVLTELLSQPAYREMSLSDLARRLGVSTPTVMREIDRLSSTCLVVSRVDGASRRVRLNRDSALYAPMRALLGALYGAEEGNDVGSPRPQLTLRGDPTPPDVRELLPPAAQWDVTCEVEPGVDPVEGRARALSLRDLSMAAHETWNDLQGAYASWHNERHRDLIHLWGRLPTGSAHAADVLWGDHEIPAQRWAHAVYSVAAFSGGCTAAATLLAATLELVRELDAASAHVDDIEDQLTKLRTEPAGHLQHLRDRLAEMTQRRDNAAGRLQTEGHYWYGGTPRLAQVGHSGEELIVERLDRLAARGLAEVKAMVAHESFAAWRAVNVDAADPEWIARGRSDAAAEWRALGEAS